MRKSFKQSLTVFCVFHEALALVKITGTCTTFKGGTLQYGCIAS